MKLEIMRQGHRVKRCHTVPMLQEETVGQHSAGVACILLYVYSPKAVPGHMLTAALLHDLPEQHLGDLPAPAKRQNPELRSAYMVAERAWYELHDIPNPDYILGNEELGLLKFADSFDLALKCEEEYEMGNATVAVMCQRAMEYCHEQLLFVDSEYRPRCEALLSGQVSGIIKG